jgi:ubiquinone/menaquinone biosynthesis C-methylase UbiE
MDWYNLFSGFYDKSLEKLYFESRKIAAEMLDIKSGENVLDVACGTGANFPHLLSFMDQSNRLAATDFSKGMLAKARQRIPATADIHPQFLEADARGLHTAMFAETLLGKAGFDKIICVLGLSVIPDWQSVLQNLGQMLLHGGSLVVVDVFAEKRTLQTWMVEKVARADVSRPIFAEMQTVFGHVDKRVLPVSASKVGGILFAAKAIKN